MDEIRKGRQTPTLSVVLPYQESLGGEAVELYNRSGRTAQDWQELMMEDIMALDADGRWLHMKESPPAGAGKSYNRDTGKFRLPADRERLYRVVNVEKGLTDQPFIDVYSPEIRASKQRSYAYVRDCQERGAPAGIILPMPLRGKGRIQEVKQWIRIR